MFGRAFSVLVIALVLGCPVLCGSAPLLHHHAESAPAGDGPHGAHDSCGFDECLCSSAAIPTQHSASHLPGNPIAIWLSARGSAPTFTASPRHFIASACPPRSVEFDRAIPLLI
jgi:hypothetical protein